jgi:uncharacterized membrane protein
MHWDAYTVFAAISGLVLVVSGVAIPDTKPKDRMWMFVGGAIIIAYGIYVAKQDEGTFTFPVIIFIIPFVLPVVFVFKAIAARRERDS